MASDLTKDLSIWDQWIVSLTSPFSHHDRLNNWKEPMTTERDEDEMKLSKELNLEAAKLVKEWSVWMVGVQAALIGFILKNEINPPLSGNSVNLSLGCFALSILAAAWVLGALPFVVICIPEMNDRDSSEANIFFSKIDSLPLLRMIPLWLMALIQHVTFALGLIFLILSRFL